MLNIFSHTYRSFMHLLWRNVCSHPLPVGGILVVFFLFFHISDLSAMTRVARVIMNERIKVKAGCVCTAAVSEPLEGRAPLSRALASRQDSPAWPGMILLEWQRPLWPWLRGTLSGGKDNNQRWVPNIERKFESEAGLLVVGRAESGLRASQQPGWARPWRRSCSEAQGPRPNSAELLPNLGA